MSLREDVAVGSRIEEMMVMYSTPAPIASSFDERGELSCLDWLQPGQRVAVRTWDSERVEKLHEYNQLPYNKDVHSMLLGKVGWILSFDRVKGAATVRFYTWSASTYENHAKKRLVELDVTWQIRALQPCDDLHLMDGDRVVLVHRSAIDIVKTEPLLVTVRVMDDQSDGDPLYALRTKSHEMPWRASEKPDEQLLPAYIGRGLTHILRDRCSLEDSKAVDSSYIRVINGPLKGENGKQMHEAILEWSHSGGSPANFAVAVSRYPEQVNALVDGRTPLMHAVETANWAAIVSLIALGANREIVDQMGNSLLHMAAAKGHVRIIEGLLMFIAGETNRANIDGDTPLHIATRLGHAAAVDRLLAVPGVNYQAQNALGDTALHVVCSLPESASQRAMLSRILTNQRFSLQIENVAGFSAMHLAIFKDSPKTLEMMIQSTRMHHVAVNMDSGSGMTPLLLAAKYGRTRIVEMLLGMGADVTKTTLTGQTAMHLVVQKWQNAADKDLERLACIQSLVSASTPVSTADFDGQTPCHYLIRQVFHGNDSGNASRRMPSFRGRNSCGLNISPITFHQIAALQRTNTKLDDIAAKLRPNWQLATLCYLAIKGADLNIKDRSGSSVIDCCLHEQLREMLIQISSQRPRTCLPMATADCAEFDMSEVTMCTFNCEDSVADVKFEPCGHRVTCRDCAGKTPLRRCPLCYQTITRAVCVTDGTEVELGGVLRALAAANVSASAITPEVAKESRAILHREELDRKEQLKEADKARQEELEELRQRLEQLEMETSCAICMDARPTQVFNCGHTACVDCGRQLKQCHICRETITKTQTIYS